MKRFYSLSHKKTNQVILVVLVMVGVFSVGADGGGLFSIPSVFAVGSGQPGVGDALNKDIQTLFRVVDLLSWLWIVPATIAGQLMTNAMAYGKPFFLDTYLFKIWQFSRTMAFFMLGFGMVFSIVKFYVTMAAPSAYIDLIKKTVIAGILIPSSWFILASFIDFSIIGTSAVAGIPLMVMQGDGGVRSKIQGKVWCYKEVKVDESRKIDTNHLNKPDNKNTGITLNQIMPSGDSVAGSLIFMGCGIVSLNDTINYSDQTGANIGEQLLATAMKALLNIMMVTPMIVLMVVNMMRIFMIWLWAMFAPIIALDYVFGGPLTNKSGSYQKYFSPGQILGLIFQPVAVVGMVSICMVLLLGIYNAQLKNANNEIEGLQTFQVTSYSEDVAKVGSLSNSEAYIMGSLLSKSKTLVGGAIGELILSAFVIIFLWSLLEIGFSSADVTSGTANKMFAGAKNLMQTIPLMPVNGEGVSFGAMKSAGKSASQMMQNAFRSKQAFDADRFSKSLGMSGGQSIIADIENSAASSKSPVSFLRQLKSAQTQGSLQGGQLNTALRKWTKSSAVRGYLRTKGIITKDYSSSDELFSDANDAARLSRFVVGIMRNNSLNQNSDLEAFLTEGLRAANNPGLPGSLDNQTFNKL